ncbi:hypothetical protein OAG1_12230 [Agarivorans sp. OAG1]|uniref:Uncharacterized protein n=1 Tax=Agarivorans albus MKT 106 TaxID=1331007 RepID=R9PPC8_AGAAL|nr:hypothetical protein [Agarivorans albus]BEU02423.1 hypothetical protein OAG1_12230 [Agarivorans sp. OAG1]GAD03138.1 hypothetical protein AALB_3218 [Agarivorans albus MKT 106]
MKQSYFIAFMLLLFIVLPRLTHSLVNPDPSLGNELSIELIQES